MNDEQIQQALFDRGRRHWARANPSAPLKRLLRPLFARPLDVILFVSYAGADPETLLCEGEMLAAWRLDGHGLTAMAPPLVARENGRSMEIGFHKPAARNELIVNEMERPGQGRLVQFELQSVAGRVRLTPRRSLVMRAGRIGVAR